MGRGISRDEAQLRQGPGQGLPYKWQRKGGVPCKGFSQLSYKSDPGLHSPAFSEMVLSTRSQLLEERRSPRVHSLVSAARRSEK